MTTVSNDSTSRSLFSHVVRKDWGVGVLAAEANGKRRYLFEDGEERTFADGYHQMMHRVESPDREQQAAHARLRGALATRNRDASQDRGGAFFEQLVKLRETYPDGLSDSKWARAVRGEGAEMRTPRHRQPVIDAAQQLSAKALDSLIGKQQYAQVWELLLTALRQTDLVPVAQLESKTIAPDPMRALAVGLRDLLHGSGAYEQRFDRFVAAFVTAFGQHPKWELATAPSAIVHAKEHVCVELTAFRKQLKLNGSSRSVPAQPSSGSYTTFLGCARFVANKLAEHREVPRDLLDVRDFIVFTVKPEPKARIAQSKAKRAQKAAERMDLEESPAGDDARELA